MGRNHGRTRTGNARAQRERLGQLARCFHRIKQLQITLTTYGGRHGFFFQQLQHAAADGVVLRTDCRRLDVLVESAGAVRRQHIAVPMRLTRNFAQQSKRKALVMRCSSFLA